MMKDVMTLHYRLCFSVAPQAGGCELTEAEGAFTVLPTPLCLSLSPSQPQTLPQHYVMHGASLGLPGVALDLHLIISLVDDTVPQACDWKMTLASAGSNSRSIPI